MYNTIISQSSKARRYSLDDGATVTNVHKVFATPARPTALALTLLFITVHVL